MDQAALVGGEGTQGVNLSDQPPPLSLPLQEIIEFTHAQCYAFPNFTGPCVSCQPSCL